MKNMINTPNGVQILLNFNNIGFNIRINMSLKFQVKIKVIVSEK